MSDSASLAAQLEALTEKLSPRGPYSVEAFNEVFAGHDTMQAMVLAGDGESIFSQCMKDDAALAVVEILNNLPAIITALRADQRCAELEAERARLREALVAIWERRVTRDPKWFGMTASDIARTALENRHD